MNHIDTAPRYGDAELRIGPWMRAHRGDFFLATKTGQRTYTAARDEIRRSLDRLRVDSVDLLQLHSLAHPGEWEIAMGTGGALEAAVEARAEGLTRFHRSDRTWMGDRGDAPQEPGAIRLRLGPDAVELRDVGERSLPRGLRTRYARCARNAMSRYRRSSRSRAAPGPLPSPNRNTWYQPLEDSLDIERAVHWVLARPEIFLNTVGDLDLLPIVLDAASRFAGSPGDDAMRMVVEERARDDVVRDRNLIVARGPAACTDRSGFGCVGGAGNAGRRRSDLCLHPSSNRCLGAAIRSIDAQESG